MVTKLLFEFVMHLPFADALWCLHIHGRSVRPTFRDLQCCSCIEVIFILLQMLGSNLGSYSHQDSLFLWVWSWFNDQTWDIVQ